MSYSIVGEQILKFRKEKGLTQRELGEKIGVSSSAVSQWESGGTPDISLLPVLSDVLGVTVDTLFGRTEMRRENMGEAVSGYIASLTENKRWGEAISLIRGAMISGCMGKDAEVVDVEHHDAEETYISHEGLMTAVSVGERSFLTVIHNGEGGMDDLLSSNENICRLFSTLSDPRALALLVTLYREPPKYHTAGALALLLQMDGEEIEGLLTKFTQLRLTEELSLETETGSIKAYKVNLTGATVPFLFSARLMTEPAAGIRLISDKRKPGQIGRASCRERVCLSV